MYFKYKYKNSINKNIWNRYSILIVTKRKQSDSINRQSKFKAKCISIDKNVIMLTHAEKKI
jgi:hypothetical protein